VSTDLGSALVFVVLFNGALGGLLFLLARLEPPHIQGQPGRRASARRLAARPAEKS
jgi:hypothetical protein